MNTLYLTDTLIKIFEDNSREPELFTEDLFEVGETHEDSQG